MDNVTVVMIAFQNFYNKFALQAERDENLKE
jgi:hypothetical protein